ncbi:MAG: rod-binding protein [Mariprofundales bacterium]|nr:rod-binding protein [Mariprofundales bacterium]
MSDLSSGINYATPSSSRMEPPSPEGRDEKLWQASLKFESVFMQQMMESMRKSVPESGFMPKGFAEKSYQSMMDQAIADAGSQQGPLGIAAIIYHQLKRDRVDSEQAVQAATAASDKLTTAAVDRYRSIAAQGER